MTQEPVNMFLEQTNFCETNFYKEHVMRLIDRAHMLEATRSFFKNLDVLEVDCLALLSFPSLDTNVEAVAVIVDKGTTKYLHTSPEYAMKRLLAQGMQDIFYLGHVFRKEESGRLHNTEFTMIEWYRLSIDFKAMIEETANLIRLFLGNLPLRLMTYQDAFRTYCNIDPFEEHVPLQQTALSLGLSLPPDSNLWEKDAWLDLLLSHAIEKHLGNDELTVLYDYPPSQAALARIVDREGHNVAERFEIYFKGVELCNGYHELACTQEQRTRFETANQYRMLQGLPPYPLDEDFLLALEQGLPDCCGVSVGFDRLMMLRNKRKELRDVLPYPVRNN